MTANTGLILAHPSPLQGFSCYFHSRCRVAASLFFPSKEIIAEANFHIQRVNMINNVSSSPYK